jgi:hypothetical protein
MWYDKRVTVPETLDIQSDWDMASLAGIFPHGRDAAFIRERLLELAVTVTARGAAGRVLEVAAAEAVHACGLSYQLRWPRGAPQPAHLPLRAPAPLGIAGA